MRTYALTSCTLTSKRHSKKGCSHWWCHLFVNCTFWCFYFNLKNDAILIFLEPEVTIFRPEGGVLCYVGYSPPRDFDFFRIMILRMFQKAPTMDCKESMEINLRKPMQKFLKPEFFLLSSWRDSFGLKKKVIRGWHANITIRGYAFKALLPCY